MAEEQKTKAKTKIKLKAPAKAGETIAGKLSAQQLQQEQEKKAVEKEKPSAIGIPSPAEKPREEEQESIPITPEEKKLAPAVATDSLGEKMAEGRKAKEKAKGKYSYREELLKQKEHEKFFLEREKQKKKEEVTTQQVSSVPAKIKITEFIQVGELARKLNVKVGDVIARLMKMGVMATINQSIDADTATLLAAEYGAQVEVISLYEETIIQEEPDNPANLVMRPPVVTVMGHVDHGKTKLLDALRETDIAATEAGGITQHIGAYQVTRPKGKITFLDTPGHEAFSAMRARGAQVTDIVVLVVAADDGVMPQTIEAIQHAKDAQVPIIVAINKIDKPEANPERVKQELTKYGLIPEEWGGDTVFVEVSALKRINLDKLEDAILTQAEIMELKADPKKLCVGTVIEAKLDQGRGPVATILVRGGTLRVGDPFVVGLEGGKVRAIFNDRGQSIKEAPPSTPVEILGLSGVPNAGDAFYSMRSEREAREIMEKRQELYRQQMAQKIKKASLENLDQLIEEGKLKELKLIIKADVRGSAEALQSSLEKLSTAEIRVRVILASTGEIVESDVNLASAANAMIIGFNTRANAKVRELASKEGVEIRLYNIIYEAIEEIKAAISGMLAPEITEEVLGEAEVRQTFRISGVGTVAGCMIKSGLVRRGCCVRVIRDGVIIFTGRLKSLKRFQEDVAEVKEGYECGLAIENYNDIKVNDILEFFEQKVVARASSSGVAMAEPT
ncbi:MAG: translation initiation factor IF-2 [Leptospiraceae bacterium]|nr:translation initiation factor IF-2 [Leptospiraceae bacterium]